MARQGTAKKRQKSHSLTESEYILINAMVSIAKVMGMEGEFSAAYEEKNECLTIFLYEKPDHFFYLPSNFIDNKCWFDDLCNRMHKLVS